MTCPARFRVESLSERHQQAMHDDGKGRFPRLHQQMDVIRHQAVSMNPESELVLEPPEPRAEEREIVPVPEQFLAVVASGHDVMDAAGFVFKWYSPHTRIRTTTRK